MVLQVKARQSYIHLPRTSSSVKIGQRQQELLKLFRVMKHIHSNPTLNHGLLEQQQGVDFKGAKGSHPVNEEIPPLLEDGGKLEVWLVHGDGKDPVPKEEIGKFYSGDCYIVLYAYHSGEKKEDYFLTSWMGKDSTQDDQPMALQLANKMWFSLKRRPVQGCIFQGEEPPQFIALFHPMVVLKGGVGSGYKSLISERTTK